jgi:hypothetical protein
MPTDGVFDEACALIERLIDADVRREIASNALKARTLGDALQRLRRGMKADSWSAGSDRIDLSGPIRSMDHATRRDGFHALHDWDGKADHVNENTIPIDVLDYIVRLRGHEPPDTVAVPLMFDYYVLNLLALLSLRVWDEGDADKRLDRVEALLQTLQGPGGSGQRFVADAETLILMATSHFEVVEIGYEKLLARVRTLGARHQRNVALGHAASMGCHLRFGFEATYGRDTIVMRDDNVADYPWLCYALLTLLREHERAPGDGPVIEALLNGLSGDARAFVGEAPSSLSAHAPDQTELRDRFRATRAHLMTAFDAYRPSDERYSPLAFFFNFSHNVLKGLVVDALLQGRIWTESFNDLLSASTRDAADDEARQSLARTLMGYARANPDRIRGRLMPVIVYDPQAGRRAFNITVEKLRA